MEGMERVFRKRVVGPCHSNVSGLPRDPCFMWDSSGALESWVQPGGRMAGVRHCAVDTAVACVLSTDQKV